MTVLTLNVCARDGLRSILAEMRAGKLSDQSCFLLQSRVLGTYVEGDKVLHLPPGTLDPRLAQPPFSDHTVRYVVHRHSVRAAQAYRCCLAEAEKLGRRFYLSFAVDHVRGHRPEDVSGELRARLLAKTNYTQTGYMPGCLPPYIETRLIVTSKECAAYGIMKGCECVVEHIYFSELENLAEHDL